MVREDSEMDIFWKNQLVDTNQMRELDRRTIEEFGLRGEVLMELAGKGVIQYLEQNFPLLKDAVIFCGKGNNGGDGLVVGRYLLNRKVEVTVFLLGKKNELKGDARLNLERFLKLGGVVIELKKEQELDSVKIYLKDTELIIDAIFGTGLDSEVKGITRKVIEIINEFALDFIIPVISVDIPSGVNASNGQIMGEAVRADATITFGRAKIGHYIYPGTDYVGNLAIIDIGIPSKFTERVNTWLVNEELAYSMFKLRKPDSHKGENGHCLILAGSVGKTGAAVMAGESAMRTGAGLVTLGVPASLNEIFEMKTTEVMTEPIPDDSNQSFNHLSIPKAKELIKEKDVIAIGPGIGQGAGIDEFVQEILLSSKAPIVVDADGLNSLARQIEVLKKIKAPLILTPHPGEMSRLCKMSIAQIQKDRIGVARKFAKEWNLVLVLKGARTIIAGPKGDVFINLSGNEGMASGGMGDVLTGIITGLLSQKYDPLKASVLGTYIHGLAGDLAYEEMGGVGIMAGDLISRIPQVRKWLYKKLFGMEE